MARFDVYNNKSGQGLLLDVQTDILSGLNTRMVVPLLNRAESPKPATYLNPCFDIEGEEYVMLTQFMASIPESELSSFVGTLKNQQQEIAAALDMLFVGF